MDIESTLRRIQGAKHEAHRLFAETRWDGLARDGPQEAETRLNQILEVYPRYEPALTGLLDLYESQGDDIRSREIAAVMSESFRPSTLADAQFHSGIRFLGVRVPERNVQRGNEFKITRYWNVPPDVQNAALAVFVHFRHVEELSFHGYHILLHDVDLDDELRFQPYPETFAETMHVAVPADALEGTYQIHVGLYNPSNGERFVPGTKLETHDAAVILPLSIEIN